MVQHTIDAYQEDIVSDYLASKQKLSGTVGSFEVRELTAEERIAKVRFMFELAAPHKQYVAQTIQQAPDYIRQNEEIISLVEDVKNHDSEEYNQLHQIYHLETEV